jgi:hypothetical protein
VSGAEESFRRVECVLDALLAAAKEQLRSADVQIEDKSARTYHYKNQYLFWDHGFLKEWRVEAERARVTVRLAYGEPLHLDAVPELEISWRAELFQQGHESRIDKRGKQQLPLSQIEQNGIASFVTGAIHEASSHLPGSL